MQVIVVNNIKSTIPRTESAEEYRKFVEEHSQFGAASKSLTRTLMSTLTIIKFDGSCTMLRHIIEMININKITKVHVIGSRNFVVQFFINSLPVEYGPFQIITTLLGISEMRMSCKVCLFRRNQYLRSKKFTQLVSWVSKELKINLKRRMERAKKERQR